MADDNEQLRLIKQLVDGRPFAEIIRVRDEIKQHIRSFEERRHDGMYGGALNDPRLARHRAELIYLESLLA